MTPEDPNNRIRLALEHVHRGRTLIKKQCELIEKLHVDGHNTEEAEEVLIWLNSVQGEFEAHYNKLRNDRRERLMTAGYKDPSDDWPQG
jgi:hypothetical protein